MQINKITQSDRLPQVSSRNKDTIDALVTPEVQYLPFDMIQKVKNSKPDNDAKWTLLSEELKMPVDELKELFKEVL